MTGTGVLILRAFLTLALLAAAGYGAWEIRRWKTPIGLETVSPKQRKIRGWGLFFMLVTLALWLGGTSRPTPAKLTKTSTRAEKQAALNFLAYWTLTVCCAVPLVPLALLDSRENLRRIAAERRREKSRLIADILPPPPDETAPRGRP